MVRVNRLVVMVLLAQLAVRDAGAQNRPFFYPVPTLDAIRVTRGVRSATIDTLSLAMDVYRPAGGVTALPGMIIYSLYWPEDGDRPAAQRTIRRRHGPVLRRRTASSPSSPTSERSQAPVMPKRRRGPVKATLIP